MNPASGVAGGPESERCSVLSVAAQEPLWGSAPRAAAWLALEQPGPWGARAFTQSHLDPDLGTRIEAAAAAAGVRACLIRRPGRHADAAPGRRQVLAAFTGPAGAWLAQGSVDEPDAVLDLGWESLAAGDLDAVRRSMPSLRTLNSARLLVCTNGTRDVCCAVSGRPVAEAAALAHPDRVWEVTHTSGHRFAPTGVLLPAGTLHGRLGTQDGVHLLNEADAGRTVLAGNRGRSTWPPAGQVAELAVREHSGELGLDALAVTSTAGDPEGWTVRHRDGRVWEVRVRRTPGPIARPESCGKPAVEAFRFVVASLEGP